MKSLLPFLTVLVLLLPSDRLYGHGVWAHVYVTASAADVLPEGELKATLTSDGEVLDALHYGSAFVDSGYSITGDDAVAARAFSEHSHWEPFVQAYVDWMKTNDPPPWTELESKKRVAFLMGMAAHGLQDEIFDSLFLYQVEHFDGLGQDEVDPATDGFLFLDGLSPKVPASWFPGELLVELYSELGHGISSDLLQRSSDVLCSIYLNDDMGPKVLQVLGETQEPRLPWMREHYLDLAIPGSIASEIEATARYMESIWSRLHGVAIADTSIITSFPKDQGQILGFDSGSVDSWVTMIYGSGVKKDSVEYQIQDESGQNLSFETRGTQWGSVWTRLHRLVMQTDLQPGFQYSASLLPGHQLIDGSVSSKTQTVVFEVGIGSVQTDCSEDSFADTVSEISDVQSAPDDSVSSPGCSSTSGGDPASLLLVLFLLLIMRRVSRLGYLQSVSSMCE